MTTITRTGDSATSTPELVLGYATERQARTVIHDLLDGSIAVALVAPRPRTGTLELLYPSEANAWSAFELHSDADSFTIADAGRPDINMTYVVTGHRIELDDATRDVWIVRVDYQEVVA